MQGQAPVRDRVEQSGVEAGLASQFLGIDPVTLAITPADGRQLTGMGNQDLVTVLAQLLTHPQGVRSGFQRNPSGLERPEVLL